jgi:hypothetical protein
MTVTVAYHIWTRVEPAAVRLVEFASVEEAKGASLPEHLVTAFIFEDGGHYSRGPTSEWVYTDYS